MRRILTNKILLGVLCIAIGMVPLLTMVNMIGSGKAMLSKEFNHNGNKLISVKLNSSNISYKDLETLEQEMPEIQNMIPITSVMISISSYKSSSTVELKSVGSDYWKLSGLDIIKGSFFSDRQVKEVQNVVVIDDMTADKLFGTTDVLGRSIKVDINGAEVETVIVGVCKRINLSMDRLDGKEGMAFIPITLLDDNSDNYSIDETMLTTNLHIEEAKARLEHYFESIGVDGSQLDISFVNQLYIISSFLDRYGMTFLAAALLWFVAVIVGLINIMLVDIEKQKKYYGLLRFYGNTDIQIRRIIYANSFVIGIASTIASIILGLIASFVICIVVNIPIFISIHTLTLGVLLPGIICLAAAIYPGIKATKIEMNKVIWQID